MTINSISQRAGETTSLTIAGLAVPAVRYELPGTGDWVVAAERDYGVCVAGLGGVDIPPLELADMSFWGSALEEQAAIASES